MDMTARLNLPLLAIAQAAKEATVNESLTALDIAVQPVVQGDASAPPVSPLPGQAWIVGAAPSGVFAGHAGDIAAWTAGGWRFFAAFDGMTAWSTDGGMQLRRGAGGWTSGAAIADPAGGSTTDSEARAAIGAILDRLRDHGLVAA